jgi:excisionase family DNA binding protein
MQRKSGALKNYLTIKEAADFLGVTPETLRNWDRAGKMRAARHPINRYRLYLRDDLVALLGSVTPVRAMPMEGASAL